ncbi:hypothetical protein OF83DRAFT_1176619 [Amylostereum chailletii]|nr:hypothetical protein OF83DRAFT_1176619 [Amylostereum chailletii]
MSPLARPEPKSRGKYANRRRAAMGENLSAVLAISQDTRQCLWGQESAKKANTKAYVDSLRNMNRLLEKKVKVLEAEARQYISVNVHPPPPEDMYPEIYSHSSPGSDDTHIKTEELEDPEIAQLVNPANHLHLDGSDNLQLYGPTSIFRLAPPNNDRSPKQLAAVVTDSVLTYELYAGTNVDWKRYLPDEVLLTQKEHDRILDLLFRFFTSWCLRLIPEFFLRDMYRVLSHSSVHVPPRTAHYSPMLHNSLLAVATAFSDVPEVKDAAARRHYAQKALSYLEAECEHPNISALLALSILANYHSSQGAPTLGYMYFGISARISQALGLGVDCRPWVDAGFILPAGMRDRNWAFWTTFCQDTTWSLYVGRDFCVNSLSNHQGVSVPFVDEEPESKQWRWGPDQIDRPSHLGRTFAATCTLLSISRKIMEVVSNFPKLGVREEADAMVIGRMDLQLSTWKDNLPPEVDVNKTNISSALPQQLMLQMTYQWLLIVLHRPFYRRKVIKDEHGYEVDHVKNCDKAALAIMDLAAAWQAQYTLRYVPITFIQVVSAAGTIFILAALQAASGPRLAQRRLDEARHMTQRTIDYLVEIGESFASARGFADILRSLLERQVQTRVARRMGDPSPSPEPSPPSASSTLSSESHANPRPGSHSPHLYPVPVQTNGYHHHSPQQRSSPVEYSAVYNGHSPPESSSPPIAVYPLQNQGYQQQQEAFGPQAPQPMQFPTVNGPMGMEYQQYSFNDTSMNFTPPMVNMGTGSMSGMGMGPGMSSGGGDMFMQNPLMMFGVGQQEYMSYYQQASLGNAGGAQAMGRLTKSQMVEEECMLQQMLSFI